MTATPPPMPYEAIRQLTCVIPFRIRLESNDSEPVGNLRVILESAEKAAQEVEVCCAQWMERITALEADRKMLREALEKLTHYAECQVAAFSSGRPSLDMTLFPRLCADARTALENTK